MEVAAQGILFDLDRTLVDLQSYTDYAAALRDLTALVGEQRRADVPDADWDAPTLSTMAILVALSGDGRWSTASQAVAKHEQALDAALAGSSWRASGEAVTWYYDPPWTLPFLRRNEVARPVEPSTSAPTQ